MTRKNRKRKPTYTIVKHHSSLTSIVRRYEAGEPMRVLTSEYDVDASTVRNIVRRAGAPLRPVGRPRIQAEATR